MEDSYNSDRHESVMKGQGQTPEKIRTEGIKEKTDIQQEPLYRELLVLKREIEVYENNKTQLADSLWLTGIFLILNNMVAGGLLFLAVAVKELWEPEMKKRKLRKYV